MNAAFNRRSFLTALGLGSTAALFTGSRSASAQTNPIPKRLLLLFSSSGTIKGNWRPMGTGTSFALGNTLSPILAPLEGLKDKLLVVDGLDMRTARQSPGGPHPIGIGGLYTGWELREGTFNSAQGQSGWPNGPSVDQVVAQAIGRNTPFRSVELGVQVQVANNYGRMSFRAVDQPNPPEENPYRAFDRLFGGVAGTAAEQAAVRARRASVLDFVRTDLTALGASLGSDDRQRLDAHVTGVREIEQRIQMAGQMGATCVAPVQGTRELVHTSSANFPAVTQLQLDILVAALACNLTRVGSLQWSRGISRTTFPSLGIAVSHHSLSHQPDSNADARQKLTQINRWYAQQVAYLLRKLDAIQERDGTSLLDHTLVVWGNELSKGNNHSHDDMPFVLAGMGRELRLGRYESFGDRAHNDLLLTICRAMGLTNTSFGNPRHCTNPLGALLR